MTNEESKDAQSKSGLFGSILGENPSEKAWGFWESLKSNPTIQQAQQQAQEAWKNYHNEALRERIVEFGRNATIYIDEADRKLGDLEQGAVSYLTHRGTELVDKVKEVTQGQPHDGEVLFSGPDRAPLSRLDAELIALNSAPDQIQAAAASAVDSPLSPAERAELLEKSAELQETYALLVPTKITETKFWNGYSSLRLKLEQQDQRRKQLIQSQETSEQHEFDDWGSSDEEEDGKEAKSVKSGSKRPIEEEGSDSDWE